MSTTHVFWYLARSSGFLAYLFAWGSVVLGLLMTTRVADRIDRATQYILHRLLGLGSVIFLGVHLYTLLLDPWANFSLADLFVPFHTTYAPFWTGCGILAAYLLIVVTVTSIFQQRLPKTVWRGTHYLSFLTFFVGLAHGIGSGTDSSQLWAKGLYALTAIIVFGLCLHRVLWEPQPAKRRNASPVSRRIDPRASAFADLPAALAREPQSAKTGRSSAVRGTSHNRAGGTS